MSLKLAAFTPDPIDPGMWVCARTPGKPTEAMQRDFLRHPLKLMRIMTKGGWL